MIDVMTDRTIGMAIDTMIIETTIVAGPEEIRATIGTDHHGCRSYRLLDS
jgi:hypothetical protein